MSFRNQLGKDIFYNKYALTQADTWPERARMIVEDVCGSMSGRRRVLLSQSERDYLVQLITQFKFIPGGRYIYYAGRKAHFFNNCFCLKAEEDTREEWAAVAQRSTSCLMTGGGIGVDYSLLRGKGRAIGRTGGVASGPLSLAHMVNEIGRNVMQGGSRRSAIFGTINWRHPDADEFLRCKDWDNIKVPGSNLTVGDLKRGDYNWPAPFDMTNISISYDDEFLDWVDDGILPEIYVENVRRAMTNGEPGFCFNFGLQSLETLRNA